MFELDCCCCGVRGELEYDDELELAAAALLLSPYDVLVGIVIDEDIFVFLKV